ncbi:MAG: M15 family metallopeptidase [Actinomycetota bacterium]
MIPARLATLVCVFALTTSTGVGLAEVTAISSDSAEQFLEVRRSGGLDPETQSLIDDVVWKLGAQSTTVDRVTLRLWKVTRGNESIQQSPPGFGYPVLVSGVDPASPVITGEAAIALHRGQAVMGEITASLRGAVVGDRVDLEPVGGGIVALEIGAIVPDRDLQWSEIWVSNTVAASLRIDRPFSVLVWGVPSDLTHAALRIGLADRAVRISGETQNGERLALSDAVLPVAMVKQQFGEFAIRPGRGDEVEIERSWVEQWIIETDLPIVGAVRCHRLVVPFAMTALRQIERAGLAAELDPADFQAAGGCFNPRYNRGGDPGHSLSRHAWGIALDFNPSTNRYGTEPFMSEAVAAVFRGWGFSWGGTWAIPDGMHFEWHHLPSGSGLLGFPPVAPGDD